MKSIIYVSGILGGLLLAIRIVGIIAEFSYNDLLLISGLILLVLIYIPLTIVERYRHNKKIDRIINSHKGKSSKTKPFSNDKTKVKGWSMNSSPFRNRKSGLTWGGGNIKAANASRGNRKKFLK